MKQIFTLILMCLLLCGVLTPVALVAEEPNGIPSSPITEEPDDVATPSAITLTHFGETDPPTAQAFALGTPLEDIFSWFSNDTSFIGYDDLGNYYYNLMVTWSFDTVDTNTPGVYHLSVTPDLRDTYTLADGVSLPQQPYIVSIQNPGELEINCYMAGRGPLRFPWVFSTEQSEQLKQLEQLGQQDTFATVWIRQNNEEWIQLSNGFSFVSDAFHLSHHMLEIGSTYDLQIDYPGGKTGILTFQYDDELSIIHYAGGDRDGGDVKGGGSLSGSQPAPTPPKTPSYPQDEDLTNEDPPNIEKHTPVQNRPSPTLDKTPWWSFFTPKQFPEKRIPIFNELLEEEDDKPLSFPNEPQENQASIPGQVQPEQTSVPDQPVSTTLAIPTALIPNLANHVVSPAVPDNTDAQPNTIPKSQKPTPTVQESYSSEETVISGMRLRDLCIAEESVVFGSGNLTVSIPSKVLLGLNLSDFDTLSVKLNQPKNNQVTLAMKVSDTSISELTGTIMRMHHVSQSENAKITVLNEAGKAITDATFDGEFLRFVVDTAGTYTISETPTIGDTPKGRSPLLPISSGLILATGGFVFFRWKRYG